MRQRVGRLVMAILPTLAVLLTAGVTTASQGAAAADTPTAITGSFAATGFFHVAQASDGRWWFVDPSGKPFYSTGIDHVSASPDVDVKTGLCPYCQAIASQYPSTAAWAAATVAQLRSWGFNTMGDYSDTSTFAPVMPYTVQLSMASGDDWFAPSFVTHANEVAATQVAPLATDPNLIGYYTDSELAWGPNEDDNQSLLDQYLELPPGSPGLAEAQQFIGNPSGFATALATRYFSVTSAALHAYDPNHLNLGVKAESNDIPPELLQVASQYVDVFSIDDYALQPGDAAVPVEVWNYLPVEPNFANFEALVHKPLLIAEYSFRAITPTTPDTVPSILATYPDQAARAAAYTNYIGTMVQTAPWLVGDHWFEYTDEPQGGRFDGENSDFGLVSTANVPYEDMVQAVSLMHAATPDKAVNTGPECDSWAATAQGTTCTADMPAESEPLTIETSSLPTAPYQVPYSEAVVVGGGTPGYTFSAQGQFPPGLTLDTRTGLLSGSPTALGDFDFTVQVTDSSSPAATTTVPLSLDVVQTPQSDPVPTLTSLSPAQGIGQGGGTITINGTGFTQGLAGPTTVAFGQTQATNVVVNAAGTQLTATVPPATANGTVAVQVTTPGGSTALSAADLFTYFFARPSISAVSPPSGPVGGGTAVTLTGNGFLGASGVTFGGNPASFVVHSDTTITATAPAGAGGTRVDISVSGPGGTSAVSAADAFTYGPIVTAISPGTGPASGGTSVTIRGAGFGGATAVNFGSVPATGFTVSSATTITATAPAGTPASVAVTVTAPGGTSPLSTADLFTYIAARPAVTGLTPAGGPAAGGTAVTLIGASFTGATTVSFGGIPATFTVSSANSITATAPPGTPASIVNVTVTGPGGTSAVTSSDTYSYGPLVSSVAPHSGSHLGGTTVTISGVGLTGATSVHFGSTAVASGFTVNSAGTQITVTAPPGVAGTVGVTVTVGGTVTAVGPLDQYTYV
ncbi:MAG: IPT/TIG domain-containing protein [Acidimicrobiales bacterium]